MVSITRDMVLPCDADSAWGAISDPGQAHRAFAGVLTDCVLDGDVRTVTFANGMVIKEHILSIDAERRRIAYFVIDGPFTHHNASIDIREEADGKCRFVWSTDLLPDTQAAMVAPLMEAGMKAFAANLAFAE